MKLKIINNRYRYARINAGYSQIDVVNILGYITKGALSSYERGTSLPSNKILYSLSKLYNASLDYLVKEDNYMNHEDFVKETMQLDYESINILNNIKNSNHSLRDFENYLLKLKEECSNVNYWKKKQRWHYFV